MSWPADAVDLAIFLFCVLLFAGYHVFYFEVHRTWWFGQRTKVHLWQVTKRSRQLWTEAMSAVGAACRRRAACQALLPQLPGAPGWLGGLSMRRNHHFHPVLGSIPRCVDVPCLPRRTPRKRLSRCRR